MTNATNMHSRYGKRESGFSALSVLIALALLGTLGYIHLTGQLTVFHGVLGFIALLGLFGISWLQSEQNKLKDGLERMQQRLHDERRTSQEAERALRVSHSAAQQYRDANASMPNSAKPSKRPLSSARPLNRAVNRNNSSSDDGGANNTLLMHSAVLSGNGGGQTPSSRDSCRSAYDSDSSRSWDSGSRDSSSSHSSSSDSSSSSSDSSCGGGGD